MCNHRMWTSSAPYWICREAMTNSHNQIYEFDVALSFAGEDRPYVNEVAEALKAASISVFLDADHVADMWGEDLVEYLDRVYRERAHFTMMFVSRHYAEKIWPTHERRSAMRTFSVDPI